MTEKTYNGWANYETWLVNLWLDNDSGTYDYWRERAEEACKYADDEDEATETLREWLESEVTESVTEGIASSGLAGDLINSALCEVDWHEIAAHMTAEPWEARAAEIAAAEAEEAEEAAADAEPPTAAE